MPIITSKAASGGSSIPSGSGSPVGSVTPTGIGGLYIETTHGALYIATGATNADWIQVGGDNGSQPAVPGVDVTTGQPQITSKTDGAVVLTDLGAIAGTGNSLTWSGNNADGAQTVDLFLGSTSQFEHQWLANGVYHVANGIIFPTADPHVAGAWWDNAGTLTKSAG